MNRTSKTPLAIGSFFVLAVWLVWFIVSAVTGEKGRLGDIPFVLLLWGGIGFLTSVTPDDIAITEKGFAEISFFSKKEFPFTDIEIISIGTCGGRGFAVGTMIKTFCFAYTKANYAALKEIIPLVKYSKISVEELEVMVKKTFSTPS